jgi:hypothetical protein
VPQTPVKVGVPRDRFFVEDVKVSHRTKRPDPSDPFGNYVPNFKKKNVPRGTPIDESETPFDESDTPNSETLIVSGTPIGGSKRKRRRKPRITTRRTTRRRATRRRTRRRRR